jgi:hypothetical protein
MRELWFKSSKKFILKAQCNDTFTEVKSSPRRRVNIYQDEYWAYSLRTIEIPFDKQFLKQIPKKSFKNYFLRYIARRLPTTKFAMKLYDKIEWKETDELVTSALFLLHDYDKTRVTVLADITYDQKKPTEDDPKYIKKGIKEKNQPWFRVLDLKMDESVLEKSIKTSEEHVDTIQIKDRVQGELWRESEDNLRTRMAVMQKENNEKYKELSELLNKTRETLSVKERESVKKLGDQLENIRNAVLPDYEELITRLVGKTRRGMSVNKAIIEAFKEIEELDWHNEKKDFYKDHGDLGTKVVMLETKLAEKEEQLDFFKKMHRDKDKIIEIYPEDFEK